jgi:hypothetical protein
MQTDRQKHRDWFNNLKPGDEVVLLLGGRTFVRTARVARLTKTRLVIDGTQTAFLRANGRVVEGTGPCNYELVEPGSPVANRAYEETVWRNRIDRAIRDLNQTARVLSMHRDQPGTVSKSTLKCIAFLAANPLSGETSPPAA